MTAYITPTDHGRRVIPALIDERARSGHKRPFACISTAPGSYRDISYWDFANGINRCAAWLLQHVKHGTSSAPLVYIGPSDLRYQLFIIAAFKIGCFLFLPSPRNNEGAFRALLEDCGADVLLTTSEADPSASLIMRARSRMQRHIVPELDALLEPTPVDWIEYRKTWEESRRDPFVLVHTSGSTGTPKLVTVPHGTFSAVDGLRTVGNTELSWRFGNMRVLSCFPPFHIAGITYSVVALLWVDSTVILPPPGPLTPEVINRAHVQGAAEFSMMPPSLVMDLAANPEYLANLCNLKGLSFAGGPLPESIGGIIASKTRLLTGLGTTESPLIPQLRKDPSDWPYIAFDANSGGLEFQERDAGLYELVIHRRPELDLAQPVFVTYPELQTYHTKDLFERHPDPEKPGLWRYKSRLDDIIVLSNGEKLNPVTIEGKISALPAIKGCLVVGQGYFQAAMLLEPVDGSLSEAELVKQVWPTVQEANAMTVRHGRITRELITITTPDKPLLRAGKGTIQRAANVRLYEREIEQLYQRLEHSSFRKPSSIQVMPADLEGIKRFIHEFVQRETENADVSRAADFFSLGLDSLQLISLVRTIRSAQPDAWVDLKQVYDHPSVDRLAEMLHSKRKPVFSNPYDSDDEDMQAAWLDMDRMYGEITAGWTPGRRRRRLPRSVRDALRSTENGPVIPPDGGLMAWRQVIGSFLININNWGLVNAFGAFQAFYGTVLLPNRSQEDLAWIGTVQGALILIVGVFSGPLFDTGYFKVIAVVASFGLVFALMMLSLCTQYWQVMLAHTLIGLSSGLLYIPSVALIPVYFKHRRGLAIGLATGGGSIGGIIYPVVFVRLIDRIGFPWTVRVLGFIGLATLGVATLITEPLGARTRRQLLHAHAFKDPAYVFFSLSAFLIFAALLVPFFLSTTFATNALNITTDLAYYLLPCLNACQFVGRIVSGWWCDYHHRYSGVEVTLFLAEIAAGVLGFGWIGVHTLGGYVPWLICFGFVSGILSTLPAVVLPHVCPNLAVYGTRLGMLYTFAGLGFLISTPVASSLNNSTGGFLGSQLWTGASCIAGALCFGVTAVRARKRRLLYEQGKPARKIGARMAAHRVWTKDSQEVSEKSSVA